MRCFLAGVCLLMALPCCDAQETSSKQDVYAKLQQQRYAEAETEVRPLIERLPQDCQLRAMLGLALRGERKTSEAMTVFLDAAKACPQSLAVLDGAAELAYAQHRPETYGLLASILRLRPEDATAHAMRGSLEARDGNCEAAVEDDEKAMPQVERQPAALRQYAGCLMILERKQDAVRVVTQLLAMEDSAANRMALARAQSDVGDRAAALATLEPLLTTDSHEDAALLLAAQIAEADNHTPQAVAWLRQAMEVAPKKEDNYVYFAEVSFNHGSYQVGVDFVDIGLRELPGNARLLLARGVLEVQMGKLDAALKDFEEAHRNDPKLSFADDAIGVLFSQKHNASEALALFAQQRKAHPDDPMLQYLYAEALTQTSADASTVTPEAIAAARRAIALEPSYTPARDLLCALLLRQGDLHGVVMQAEEATKRNPFDEAALYQQLQAERRLGHSEKTQELTQRLQAARRHNQTAVTKYMLHEEATGDEAK